MKERIGESFVGVNCGHPRQATMRPQARSGQQLSGRTNSLDRSRGRLLQTGQWLCDNRRVQARLIDKTKVTCIKWVPGSANLFLVSHSSGQLYLYNEELPCGTTPPHYQPFKHGDGFAIHTCKTKSTRNPLYRWVIGSEGCCINEFAFSPCGTHLAIVSQDGFLRVFHYDTMDLLGAARSYFGGFLCVCWSPDGRYVVVGGEDDLVTVWSFHERRVVARGQGHRSWVSVVAFDPYTTSYSEPDNAVDFSGGSDDEGSILQLHRNHSTNPIHNSSVRSDSKERISGNRNSVSGGASNRNSFGSDFNKMNSAAATCYRLGSVGQDTQLCLWDITEDLLKQPVTCKSRTTSCVGSGGLGTLGVNGSATSGSFYGNTVMSGCNNVSASSQNNTVTSKFKDQLMDGTTTFATDNHILNNSTVSTMVPSLTQRLAGLGFGEKKDASGAHKRNFSLPSRSGSSGPDKNITSGSCRSSGVHRLSPDDPMRLIGTGACPRFDECPVLEPLVCKKIAHERLTALVFREDCFVTACQDGYVYTWARPGRMEEGMAAINCPGVLREVYVVSSFALASFLFLLGLFLVVTLQLCVGRNPAPPLHPSSNGILSRRKPELPHSFMAPSVLEKENILQEIRHGMLNVELRDLGGS
ncbi:hypothetical protein PR048_016342 [Dryococelus australis]|uniref:WD repeat-containing protein 20 n=1 Tax=Dryococelus australis TaxID=614101 RepID=A0ABQ9HJX4_9NEOP|nr:hypothetical protein PR048_016342 [Dryococelus australis]